MSARPLPEAAYLAALSSLDGMGPARLATLTEGRRPHDVWTELVSGRGLGATQASQGITAALVGSWAVAARRIDLDSMWRCHAEAGVDVLTPNDAKWPIDDPFDPHPPAILFGTGPLSDRLSPSVAIVGSRRATHYGTKVATMLGEGLAEHGVAVVSGLAVGIDGAAQRAALDAGGSVVGVVASGLDVIYPRANARLWNEIAARGRLWSETPLGVSPNRWRFPARNRIIAALADVVVVVESAKAGGSLHTVDAALDRDRAVMAVPGPVTSEQSLGTNRLLVQGCAPVSELADVLVALGLQSGPSSAQQTDGVLQQPASHLTTVLEAVDFDSTSTDTIIERTGLGVATVLARLGELAGGGHIADVGGWWQRS